MNCSTRIQTGATEPIEVLAIDILGQPLIGKTDIKAKIRRKSDGYAYDWSDNTFKTASSVTTLLVVLNEVDAANFPGEYSTNFNTSLITNPIADDTYEITVIQTPGTDALNFPQIGELKVGQWVDYIDQPISDSTDITIADREAIADAVWDELLAGHAITGSAAEFVKLTQKIMRNKLELSEGASGNWVLYDDDNSTVLLTWDVTDKSGEAITIAPRAPAKRTRGI